MSNVFQKPLPEATERDLVTHVVLQLLDRTNIPLDRFLRIVPTIMKMGYDTVEVPGMYEHHIAVLNAVTDTMPIAIDVDHTPEHHTIYVDLHDSSERVRLILLR